jgi:Skp family chaperone for outer membrane proteins
MKPLLIFANLVAIVGLLGCKQEGRNAYVDNARLFREVKSFSVIQDSVKAFNQTWQSRAQVLKDSVDQYMKRIGSMQGGISNAERAKVEKEFQDRQTAFKDFVAANQKKASELDKEMSESAVKKVNAILQAYRDEKGYAIIFGTTTGGNILAADKSLDVTDDMIRYVNGKLK